MRIICLTFMVYLMVVGGCSCPRDSSGGKKVGTSSSESPQEQGVEAKEKAKSAMIEVKDFAVTKTNLELGYCLKNPFSHEIWAADPLSVKMVLYGLSPETRIVGDTLHIDFRVDVPSGVAIESVFAVYRRLPPGQSRYGTVLLKLPVVDNSIEYADKVILPEWEKEALVHRVVFEIGYFNGDLPAALSKGLEYSHRWQPEYDDPNVVFVPHWWKDLNLEQSTQVTIENVEVPVRVPK